MKITVIVETGEKPEWSTETATSVTNTRSVAVGGPHEWMGAIKRVTDELGLLAATQLMQAADYDAERGR